MSEDTLAAPLSEWLQALGIDSLAHAERLPWLAHRKAVVAATWRSHDTDPRLGVDWSPRQTVFCAARRSYHIF